MHVFDMQQESSAAFASDHCSMRFLSMKEPVMLDATIHDKIDGLREDITALVLVIRGQQEQFRMLAEMNRRLIEILTPAQRDDSGQSLAALLARLADEVERQNRAMEELNGVIVQYIRDMPGMVSKSVLEGTGGLLAAIRDLPGKVMTAVQDVL
jgi:uncharacterized protein YihD (DUF1040 family)